MELVSLRPAIGDSRRLPSSMSLCDLHEANVVMHKITCIIRLAVGFMAMRIALGTPDIFDEEVIMKKINYRLAQKCVKLAILVVKFAQELFKLLSMAFNYQQLKYSRHAASTCKMDL